MGYKELAEFSPAPPLESRNPVLLDEKINQSAKLLSSYADDSIKPYITVDNFRLGIVPRLSTYDIDYLPKDVRFVEFPKELIEGLKEERSYDLRNWNLPSQFLHRLRVSKDRFEPPTPGKSRVMDRLTAEGTIVAFDDLRVVSPEPKEDEKRQSRSLLNDGIETNIMGQGRIPFALGSVPDVGSFLSYVTMAQANGMVFISRDKVLSDIDQQVELTRDVVDFLRNVHLPSELYPNVDNLKEFADISDNVLCTTEDYLEALRSSWISNVGAAVEASEKGVLRAMRLHEIGCNLFRIYSPEGGTEIIDTARKLKSIFSGEDKVKIVGGQIMDTRTAQRAEAAGCDAIFIGVAGGSQCTTSVNADIPVDTPNLLYNLRGRISIPVGIEGGGVGTHIMTAFVLGASFLSKPGEIGVSWEGSGGQFVFKDRKGNYYMPYGGEASISAKWWKDSVDDIERPRFVEGETGVRQIHPDRISQTGNIESLREQLSNGLLFQRAKSIPELHIRSCENVKQVTEEASRKSQAYAK